MSSMEHEKNAGGMSREEKNGMLRGMLKGAGILFAITLISGLILGAVYQLTKEPIAAQEEKAKTLVNQEEIVRMLEQDKSITDICKRFGLSRDTFAKFRRKYPAVQRALSDKEKRRVQQFRKNRL